jgi:hypothetical protein
MSDEIRSKSPKSNMFSRIRTRRYGVCHGCLHQAPQLTVVAETASKKVILMISPTVTIKLQMVLGCRFPLAIWVNNGIRQADQLDRTIASECVPVRPMPTGIVLSKRPNR